jgi:hypothetical protein
VLLEESEVVGHPDQRSAVSGERHDGARAEHGVDGTALKTEIAKVRAG